ncbi:MAG: hypothetical protein A2W17_02685 [Planctomycetes bacterium RBG_16_41_13]|nr:MAG: hypothetical protein A2W17_02685 [Planctomycetes bacterium RBG_16_41_13]
MAAWKLEPSPFFDSRFKRFQKKHANEAKAILNNLDTYVSTLNEGVHPINIKAGFIHHEPDGIKAIDQKGGKGKLMQSRLYIYPHTETKTLHVISIGNKTDQKGDINECRDYIKPLRKGKG